MPGERLTYPDNSFDMAVGFAILHHLDIPLALSQLRRVLKPGGRAFFAEPLASNPLIRVYRRLTPQYRTPDETPIDLPTLRAQLRSFSRFRAPRSAVARGGGPRLLLRARPRRLGPADAAAADACG